MSDSKGNIDQFWKRAFQPDSGMLEEIRVYGTTEDDYRRLLSMLATRYHARYTRDDVDQAEIPDYSVILRDYEIVSIKVKFLVAGVLVHLWFWSEDEIDLDVLPEDVDSLDKAQGIVDLMKAIARLLNKRVLLTMENASATQEWSEQYAICSINPSDDHVIYHRPPEEVGY